MRKFLTAYRNLFRAPTLEDVIEHEMRKRTLEVQQCDSVIRAHRYQRHMALANIRAASAWTEQETREGVPTTSLE